MPVAQDSNRIRIRSSCLRAARVVKLVQGDSLTSATARISLFRSGLFSLASLRSAACGTFTGTYMRLHSPSKDARGIARSLHRPQLGQDII